MFLENLKKDYYRPRTRIEFRSVDIQLFIVSNKTLCNKEQSKSQGGKETTKSKKSPVAPSPKSPVIFLILTFDILSEQPEFPSIQ